MAVTHSWDYSRRACSRTWGVLGAPVSGAGRHAKQDSRMALRALQLPAEPGLAAAAQDIVQQWAPLASHPNLVTPSEAFITAQMGGGPALVFVHAYYPAAITLEQAHMHPAGGAPLTLLSSDCRPCCLKSTRTG
jgi:hypothetical protein